MESAQALKQGIRGIVDEYKLNPAMIPAIDQLQPAYAQSGRPGYFRQALKVDGYQPRPSYYLARDHAQLGDKETALAELKRAYQNHDPEILWIFTDPELEPIRSDPRYQELVRSVGFQ